MDLGLISVIDFSDTATNLLEVNCVCVATAFFWHESLINDKLKVKLICFRPIRYQYLRSPRYSLNYSNLSVVLSTEPVDDSMYSAVDQTNKPRDITAKKSPEQFCRAQFDYEAQGDQEISFKAGDLIKRLFEEDDTWWFGEINGKKGMFPKDFVEFITK